MDNELENYKSLGVINRTPNSFSDHGFSLNSDFFKNQLQSFLADPSVIIDIGFESTAPMNQAITHEEELLRFESFLEASKDFDFSDRFVSFDTYKVKNFTHMAHAFKKLHPRAHFIFNDVSGVLDDELKAALIEFRHTKFYYIYTFTHIPARHQTLEHIKFLSKKNVIDETAESFKSAYEWFKTIQMEHQLIMDPGFGFSKTYEQNWELIENFSDLEGALLEMKITNPVLIGLSKKSFLKKALGNDNPAELEELHKNCIEKIRKNAVLNLLFRVHDPKIL